MTERIEHVEHSGCRCRKCRLVRFAEQVETLLKDEVPRVIIDKANGGLTFEEAALLFESSVRELYQQTVLQ